jgi:hypothetical protein
VEIQIGSRPFAARLLKNTPVISNEVRNLLLQFTVTTADFSPGESGFEMTSAGGERGKGSAVRVEIQIGSRPSPGRASGKTGYAKHELRLVNLGYKSLARHLRALVADVGLPRRHFDLDGRQVLVGNLVQQVGDAVEAGFFLVVEPVLNFVFLDLLSGGVELFVETNHKLTHRLFPVLDWHRPALADIA